MPCSSSCAPPSHAGADCGHFIEAGDDDSELEGDQSRSLRRDGRCGRRSGERAVSAKHERCEHGVSQCQSRRGGGASARPVALRGLDVVELAAHGRGRPARWRGHPAEPSRPRHRGPGGRAGSRNPRTLSHRVPRARWNGDTREPRRRGGPGGQGAAPACDARDSCGAPRPRPARAVARCPATRLRGCALRTAPRSTGRTPPRGARAGPAARSPGLPHTASSPATASTAPTLARYSVRSARSMPVGRSRLLTGSNAIPIQRIPSDTAGSRARLVHAIHPSATSKSSATR